MSLHVLPILFIQMTLNSRQVTPRCFDRWRVCELEAFNTASSYELNKGFKLEKIIRENIK